MPSENFSIEKASKGVKIRELTDLELIKIELRKIFFLIGLTNIPDGEEKGYLLEYIRTNYGGLNPLELSNAFTLAIQGKFKVDTKHFNNFSPEYFSRIISAYQKYRGTVLARKPESLKAPEKEWNRKLYFQEQLFKPYQELLKGRYLFSDVDEVYLYRSLDKLGIVLATLEEKKQFMIQGEKQLKPKYRETPKDKKQRVIDFARSMAFQTWIKNLVDNKTDIKELILPLIK
jgi:hypothetical protein